MYTHSLLALLFVLMLSSGTLSAEPDLSHWLGPRPEINNYDDRDSFIVDVLAWEKRRSELLAKLASGELKMPSDEIPTDWHTVTGPEDLDTALRHAQGYVQPHYEQTYRFNRTTHISFPLSRLPADQLAKKRVDADKGADNNMNLLVNELTQSSFSEIDSLLDPLQTEAITRQPVETRLR